MATVFDPSKYLQANQGLQQAIEGEKSKGVGNWNPDILKAAEEHYNQYGKAEGRPTGQDMTQTTPQQPQVLQPTGPSYNDLNAQLVAAQKQAKLSGLTNSLNSSISTLNQQDAAIDPQAYKDRAIKSNQSQVGGKNFAEFLANRGQINSGFANQSELNRNMQLSSDIGAIDTAARAQHNKIATDKTNLQTAFNNDVASANAGIEADSLNRQLQNYKDQQSRQDALSQFEKNYGISLAGLTGKINGQDTLATQQLNNDISNTKFNQNMQTKQLSNQEKQQIFDNAMATSGMNETKAQNDFVRRMQEKGFSADEAQRQWENTFQTTQARKADTQQIFENTMATANFDQNKAQNDFVRAMQTKGYDADQAQREWENNFNVKKFNSDQDQRFFDNVMTQSNFDENKAQNEFVRTMQQKGFTADQAQRKFENALNTKQFTESVRQNNIAQGNWQKEMTVKQAQDKIDNAFKSKQISQDSAQLAIQQMKAKAELDPNSLDNQYKKAQLEHLNSSPATYDFKTDPDFADDVEGVLNDENAEETITKNAAMLIKKYGKDGFEDLLKKARGE